jgi:hypothetical protein
MDNIRIDLKVTRWGALEWVHLLGSCEHGNELSDFIKCGVFLDYLNNY